MPTVQDMPTPDGPLAPTSTRSYQPHGANSGSSTHSGSAVAVQHINAVDLSDETELAQIQNAPTESGESLFGDRSIAGPLGDEESDRTKTQSSEALGRALGGYRSIGSDLTTLDDVRLPNNTSSPCNSLLHSKLCYFCFAHDMLPEYNNGTGPLGLHATAQKHDCRHHAYQCS